MYNVTRILNAQEIQPEILDKGIAKKKEGGRRFSCGQKNPKAYTPLGWKTGDNAATLNKREQHVDLTEAIRRLSIYA